MIIQDKCDFSQEFIDYVQSDHFPWYHHPFSSSTKFPFVGHVCIHRKDGGKNPAINSTIWGEVKRVLLDFTSRNGIEIDEYLRCNVNMTHATSGKYPVGDKHVDERMDHMVWIAYLNDDCSGATVIYDKKWQEGDPANILLEEDDGTIKEKLKVEPKLNTAVCFDGRYYHANTFPQLGERRIVCVVNFTVKN